MGTFVGGTRGSRREAGGSKGRGPHPLLWGLAMFGSADFPLEAGAKAIVGKDCRRIGLTGQHKKKGRPNGSQSLFKGHGFYFRLACLGRNIDAFNRRAERGLGDWGSG